MGAVSLSKVQKGERVSLSKKSTNLSKITVGLGWKVRDTDGDAYDLDSSVFLCDANGKVTCIEDFVFFNNQTHPSGSVVHQGDNKTGIQAASPEFGNPANDCEQISIDLTLVPQHIQQINFVVTIYQGVKLNQNFGQVNDAYIRIDDTANGGAPLVMFDLTENASVNTAIITGQIYRKNGEWSFVGINEGFVSGLDDICGKFGVTTQNNENV